MFVVFVWPTYGPISLPRAVFETNVVHLERIDVNKSRFANRDETCPNGVFLENFGASF